MTTAAARPEPSFTDEQAQAISTRDCSVALSAGAGCGKTFVLTERFLAYFEPDDNALRPEDLGELVAITFTERAAREMRDRIRAKCRQRLLAAKPQHAHYWADLLRALDAARISTIHAFCASLLRSRAVEAGLDPRFQVFEQAQADALLAEVIDDELRRLLGEHDDNVLDLAVRFDLPALHEMLRILVLACRPDQFQTWLGRTPREQLQLWERFFRERVEPLVRGGVASTPVALQIVEILRTHLPSHPVMQARREALLTTLTAMRENRTDQPALADQLAAILENARVQNAGGAKAWADAEVYAAFRDAAETLRDTVKAAQGVARFDLDSAAEAADVGQQLLRLAGQVAQAYTARKQDFGGLDFNDLLARAKDLLTDPRHDELRARLSAQIRLLLVDEFQDTDPLQLELVAALCEGSVGSGKLFFVGDYKQSIYRFRGADPRVFRQLREETPERGRLSLTRNFRSQPAILDFVNALFCEDLGDAYEPLRPDRPQVGPLPAVEFMWAGSSTEDKESKPLQRRREAVWIARRIRGLLDDGQPIVCDLDAKQGSPATRPAQPGDIAILFRALSDVEMYEAELRRLGIDYYLVGGRAFYAQQEIFDVLNLLRTLNSPCDLVSLTGVLRSGFFSLADETIFWLAQHPEGLAGGLFAERYPAEISPRQQERARFAAQTIVHLRQRKDCVPICQLVEESFSCTGFDALLLNEFLGARKLANLRKLVEQARSFQRGGLFSLADFIAQLADFTARQPDEALAATHSENTNVVRLMTIHQSKGLEFPIVIVPDLARPTRNDAPRVCFDDELGPLVRLAEAKDNPRTASGYDLWRFAEREEDAAELNRLLYVATTRAADYLILSSGVDQVGAAAGPWMQLLARRFDLATGRFLGTVSQGDRPPQVRLTTDEPSVRGGAERGKKVNLEELIDQARRSERPPAEVRRAVEPVAADTVARREYSFSRLAGTLQSRAGDETAQPDGQGATDARALGTLVHAVLAVVDFGSPGDIESLVRLHAPRHLPHDSPEIAVAVDLIGKFIESPRARKLATAVEFHSEVEFLLAWPPDSAAQAPALLGGYIDRLYRDSAGAWHVLDFKTNRLTTATLAAVAEPYEMQMLVYALATEQILRASPGSLVLHFLRTGDEHEFAWNERARRRVRELVEMGIAADRSRGG